MLTTSIYLLVFIILVFVLFIGAKALTRGINAKEKINKKLDKNTINNNSFEDSSLAEELNKVKKLYDDGMLDYDEFKKAKDKIINS